jgi:hypothetical protein
LWDPKQANRQGGNQAEEAIGGRWHRQSVWRKQIGTHGRFSFPKELWTSVSIAVARFRRRLRVRLVLRQVNTLLAFAGKKRFRHAWRE